MARTVRNAKIDTRSARVKLTERREPYWTPISAGCAVGYRRGAKGGTWVARLRGEDGKQHYEALGAADDARDADGLMVYSFSQAQEAAREFFARKAWQLAGHVAPADGKFTVADALDAYFADREQRGSKGLAKDRAAAKTRVLPALGTVELAKLTTKRIRDWQSALATAPKLTRVARLGAKREGSTIDLMDVDLVRARRATANRTLTVLKAALNHAFQENLAASDEAWRKVKPFREVDAPVVHFLSDDECRRIVNACDGAFRNIVKGALLTGCRYGELTRMRAGDFNAEVGTITVQESKSGKPRHVVLTDEGRTLFTELTAGHAGRDMVFVRDDGNAWGASHQQRPLEAASNRAKIEPTATFHILRHTYASALAMRGVPMGVIAAQLGHSDTRMTERHYAHLSPSYVAETVRTALPSLGIVENVNVFPMKMKAAK
ncbi:MAG: tyrosine-type recombinase/integrase [Methylocella sp.]